MIFNRFSCAFNQKLRDISTKIVFNYEHLLEVALQGMPKASAGAKVILFGEYGVFHGAVQWTREELLHFDNFFIDRICSGY